jgi:hypothetical protein
VTAAANPACEGAFLLLHITKQATMYGENLWAWVSDHELDLADHNQINIFNGRGIFVESAEGPVWLVGTSSEHSVLYNYQVANAANVYMGLIQTETPYFQSNPNSITPFTVNTAYSDPNFSATCGSTNTDLCPKSWGLRVLNSADILVYGAGLYSFFDNYNQDCLATASCQDNMVSLESSENVFIYGLSTKAATNMVTLDGSSAALDKDNRNNFCAAIAFFNVQGTGYTGVAATPAVSSGTSATASAVPKSSATVVSGSSASPAVVSVVVPAAAPTTAASVVAPAAVPTAATSVKAVATPTLVADGVTAAASTASSTPAAKKCS